MSDYDERLFAEYDDYPEPPEFDSDCAGYPDYEGRSFWDNRSEYELDKDLSEQGD